MSFYSMVFAPFADFAFMRQALVGCIALALGCGPLGVFLALRRMSLVGDALSHAILPGAAAGFLLHGLSLTAMSIGGMAAGVAVMGLSAVVSRASRLREDASFAAFTLISLAGGVVKVSRGGGSVDLMHILFGSVLAIDRDALLLLAGTASVTLMVLAAIYRMLVVDSVAPEYLRALGKTGAASHYCFLLLVVLNLVAGFQAMGTLMAVGLMMLPAVSARLWTRSLPAQIATSTLLAMAAAVVGLLLSFHADVPSGPAIVLMAGGVYLSSVVLAPQGVRSRSTHAHAV